jgi:hypothetical protein
MYLPGQPRRGYVSAEEASKLKPEIHRIGRKEIQKVGVII